MTAAKSDWPHPRSGDTLFKFLQRGQMDVKELITHRFPVEKASFNFVDESPPPGRNWYRLRVSQLNGQMAWSSPIWLVDAEKASLRNAE